MINMLLGLPGGGKSYESVVFHVLPALAAGRKVITNLALNLEVIGALYPHYLPLIEIRTTTFKPKPEVHSDSYEPRFTFTRAVRHNTAPFSNIEDYGDPWRHPENGSGPLYVIDECHISLPKIGTPVNVEEWFSMHRHEFADVLLITQTYGKINQPIREIVQVCYRVKKATAFGFNTRYIRKVQDGIRGDVVNTGIREYKKQYFKFYNSHTKSGVGVELASQDIRPIWKNWTFVGAAACGVIVLLMVVTLEVKNPLAAASHIKTDDKLSPNSLPPIGVDVSPSSVSQIVSPSLSARPEIPETPPPPEKEVLDPFKEKGLHLTGTMSGNISGKKFEVWTFAVSQNGQFIFSTSSKNLTASGYTWEPHSECSGLLRIGKTSRLVTCDSPQIQMAPSATAGVL
jgi:zona occludens toxin